MNVCKTCSLLLGAGFFVGELRVLVDELRTFF